MVDKEECKRLYAELLRDIGDLESVSFRENWLSRLDHLRELGCWWHYSLLRRRATLYPK
jgi:hypothetical protein